jgi:dTDP-4-amino-4,6-dideoxygalactose transaminase
MESRALSSGSPQPEYRVRFRSAREENLELLDDLLDDIRTAIVEDRLIYANAAPAIESFEADLARYTGIGHVVAVSSGTLALTLALHAAGVRRGDEVITSANSFVATAEAIVALGAIPVFADVDPETGQIDAEAVAACIGPATVALLPVHMFGNAADTPALAAIAERHGLALIEDCAQAIGTTIGGNHVGRDGLAGCLSFYPAKNLGSIGSGGAVLTNDGHLAERLRCLRNHGNPLTKPVRTIGFNGRMAVIEALALRRKLAKLDEWLAGRRRFADAYDAALRDQGQISTPVISSGSVSSRHIYPILSERRDRLVRGLADAGIETRIHYHPSIDQMPGFAAVSRVPFALRHTHRFAARTLSLPLHSVGAPSAADEVVAAVQHILAGAL